jgi:hypothetical protein
LLPSPSDRLALQRRHIRELHPRRSRGKICTARAARDGRGWDEGIVAPSSKALSKQIAEAEIEYQGQLRFSGRRGNANVTGIGAASLDYDFYKPGLPYAHLSAEEVAALLIETYDKAGIPRLSLVPDSGQGCYGSWLFTTQMDGKALPRWQLAMQGLRGPTLDNDGNVPKARPRKDKDGNLVEAKVDPKVEAFNARMLQVWRLHRDLGLDTGAIDPARVLKIMGTVHRETGRMSRMAWPSSWEDVERVDFDAWCDALMPYTRAEMRQIRKDRQAWKAENPDYVPPVRKPRQVLNGTKWCLIGEDLDRLLDHRGQGWFEQHKTRDWWVMFRSIAIAMTEGGTALEWAQRLAPRIGLPVAEVASSLKGVENGIRAHDAGQRKDWKGTADRPAFYDYSYTTVAGRLLVDAGVASDFGLLVVRPDGAPARTPAERQRVSRTARDPQRATRDSQSEDRIGWGSYARLMRLDGATYPELVEAFGKHEDTIRKAIREADAAWIEAEAILSVETASARSDVDDSTTPTPEGVSHPIVVIDPILPAASTPLPSSAPAVPAGTVRVNRITRVFATVETATGTWEWLRIEDWWSRGSVEVNARLLTDPAAVSPADAALAAAAFQDLATASAKPVRTSFRADRRRVSRRRPLPIQPAALAPLDIAADRVREVELYREASGGGGLRHRIGLVAA